MKENELLKGVINTTLKVSKCENIEECDFKDCIGLINDYIEFRDSFTEGEKIKALEWILDIEIELLRKGDC